MFEESALNGLVIEPCYPKQTLTSQKYTVIFLFDIYFFTLNIFPEIVKTEMSCQ